MPGSRRVLLVDDDAMFRASLAEQLRAGDAYEPVEVGTAEQGVAEGLDGHYEFLVVDSDLPDGDGCDVVRNLRKGGVNAPIILLWEQDGGFAPSQECGADDVLVKPIRLAVLLARAGARARSHKRSSDEEARIGPYVFRPHAKVLTEGERRIRLTEKESDILNYLRRAGTIVSRDTLLHEVWGYNPAVTTHTLETHIYRLRKKIERNPDAAEILLTEDGGYRLSETT